MSTYEQRRLQQVERDLLVAQARIRALEAQVATLQGTSTRPVQGPVAVDSRHPSTRAGVARFPTPAGP